MRGYHRKTCEIRLRAESHDASSYLKVEKVRKEGSWYWWEGIGCAWGDHDQNVRWESRWRGLEREIFDVWRGTGVASECTRAWFADFREGWLGDKGLNIGSEILWITYMQPMSQKSTKNLYRRWFDFALMSIVCLTCPSTSLQLQLALNIAVCHGDLCVAKHVVDS